MSGQDLKQITKIVKALADENRIRIICLLKFKKDLCVCEITSIIGLSQPTISSHLKLLENAGLIESYKDGLWVNYNIAADIDSYSGKFIQTLCKSLGNDRQIKSDEENAKKISRDIICKKKAC
ncbi:MAG: winged helix-turn-helix transcriptional regulator [Actinobacteria bacterium]|nr:winged helix-turn-helix transcriptional regulator [Actinomycetota bacterium]